MPMKNSAARVQRVDGPPLIRASDDSAITIVDEENRVIEFSFSSEFPVTRASWFDDPWVEVLGHDEKEIDLSRMNGGAAPVLYDHNRYERRTHIGTVLKAWIENSRGHVRVQLSRRDEVSDLWQDIKDGIVRNVSAGYRILERTLMKKNEKSPSEYRVTRWMPHEVSFTPIPADPTVGVGRSDDAAERKFVFTDLEPSQEDEHMPRNATAEASAQTLTPDGGNAPDQTNVRNDSQVREDATRAATERSATILEIAARHGIETTQATDWIRSTMSLDEVRAAILDKLVSQDVPHAPGASAGEDQADKFRSGAEEWLLSRSGYRDEQNKPLIVAAGSELRGMTLMDIARRSLELAGVRVVGMSRMDIALRAISHTTSDFPIVLQNVMHKTLLTAYNITPDTWREFCATGTLSDFRPHYRYRMGSFSDLLPKTEGNEFQDGTISDAERESITAATKGRMINISREMIVNDDLGAFTNIASLMGRAAKRSVEKDVYTLLALNSGMGPTLSDSVTLFHATHNNVSTGVPSVTSFDAARVIMASQTNPGGGEIIDLRPSIWLGPIALGGEARVINDAQYDPDTANKLQRPNKVRGLFSKVVDTARLSGAPWYIFADPSEEPVLEVGFLDGQQEPFLEMKEGFRVDGVSWKVRLDYAVAAVGYRGAVRSTGAG